MFYILNFRSGTKRNSNSSSPSPCNDDDDDDDGADDVDSLMVMVMVMTIIIIIINGHLSVRARPVFLRLDSFTVKGMGDLRLWA